ncbi:polymorphic toxin-type HINT domain-containing protein [Streptomyces sp. NBC_00347]|uniref:polymorphic toxin-type HINT domain-containing protein n=1 Tax=Streptomyces sp. NBC_00347 TaxID=2975721 RepID=UPI00224E1ABB|nr:polymorphic toxin-type HINT domain-containing protein [Streptomyces sp. NBC_00347]MCX5125514.1 polymorphic toxin-type HINT domain-containing protein [Streptomyces sp. NBC_00347]
MTSLGGEALAIPGPGMDREESTTTVDLPDLPKATQLDGDGGAQKALTTAREVPVDPYDPKATAAWAAGTGNATLSAATQPGATVPVTNGLPIALGVPEGTDPATVAGDWKVELASPATSQDAGVSGLVMKVTPPATVDPAAQVSLSVDTTGFADLYGPQAADRFGLVLLPECVYSSPNAGECADEGGVQTMSLSADPNKPDETNKIERLSSTVETVPAKDAPTGTTAAKGSPTRKVLTGTLPVARLLAGGSSSAEPVNALLGEDGMPVVNASLSEGVQPAANATGGSAVGMLDTGSSVQGDFTASPLLSSGDWSAGSSSGAFTYGYQVQTPETAGGLMPKVNLSYSSQSVDGRTSSTNNQASWIGDGWDYNAGSITRTYTNCREDSKKAGSNNATHRTADLCWGSDNATLSLGGMTTELVWDAAKGTWTTSNGDGSKVERLTGQATGNGAKDGEYWVVTTKDGTRYHFGLNKLPGWSDHGSAADDPTTDSVLTVPVYGNHAGEDCYKAGDWAGSYCTQGWRWSLDYVEDLHGNAMSLWWKKDQNYYARNFNFKSPVVYDRDGYLSRIDYGQRRDTIFSTEAPARIGFSVAERCYTVGSVACTEDNFKSKDPGQYRPWFDTPADLRCESGKKCWNAGPTFWTRKRLDKITTSAQRRTDTTARQVVDVYQLKQSFAELKTGPNTALWLESIQRTGYARNGSTDASVALSPVRFESNTEDMPNRVLAVNPQRPGFSRLRIARVINEYGGETVVTYKPIEGSCLSGPLPGKTDTAALKSNDRLCYPSFWNPDPEVEDIDWFHKYVVQSIEELPNVDGSYGTKTAYTYKNPAWKLADTEFTKKSTRTYSQFAGAEQTTVITGSEDPAIGSKQSKAVTRYFRGMGDTVPVKDVHGNVIKASDGSTVYDRQAFAGRVAEELSYSAATDADTNWLSRSVTIPEATELAKRNRDDGLDPLKAWRVTEPEEIAYTKSSGTNEDDPRTLREVRTKTTYESVYGLPTLVDSSGDTGKPGDESCTKTEYLHQTAKNLIGLSKQVLVSPTTCAAANFADLSTLSGAFRTAYDGTAYGTALAGTSRGLATESWSLNGAGTGFQSKGTNGFDAIGRVIRGTDPDGKSSTISFDPPTGQVFKVTQSNSLGHTQVQELEPGRAVTLKTTDANGLVSEAAFDPLGRISEAWAAGRTPSPSAVPDFRAEYTIPPEETDPEDSSLKIRKPPFVTTYSRGDGGRIETSVTLYDGLGRERQSLEEPESGDGYLVTDTLYNSSGEVWQTNNAYLTKEAKIGELFTPLADTAIPNITRYTYDGLGRVLAETPYMKYVDPQTQQTSSKEYPERATRYEYGQDWSKIINPAGASSYRVYTDALGRTVRTDSFNSAAPKGYTSVSYEYDARGQRVKATNSADPTHPWTWTYDHRGRMDSTTDPDAGVSRTEFDHLDRVVTSTNARGVKVWNEYDQLSRPKQQRMNDANGTLLADFTYDSAPGGKGMPAAATRYTDGLAYTQKVNGYTKDYQPTSTTLSLPQQMVDTWGFAKDYNYSYNYSDTGRLEDAQLPAVGALDAEKLVVRYNKEGQPLSVSGKDWYGSETVYSPYGQVLRSTLGAQPYRVWTQSSFDESSGELKEQAVYREQNTASLVGGNLVSNRAYSYDPAGNVTSVQEKSVGIEERQCFSYDPLGQLKSAWTSKEQTACTTPKKTDGTMNVVAGKDGSGYWQEYEYDLLGNRTKLTERNLAGDTAKDAVTTYEYGKNAAKDQPHTLTKVTKNYVTPAGAQITAEATRLYELTGETKSVTSVQNGDKQDLTWTYDGKVDRITGQGSGGKSPYVGLGQKCLDLKSGLASAGNAIQLYQCNGTVAQAWHFDPVPGQADAKLGTLEVYDTWCIQPASNTAGAAAQVQKCDGSAAQQLKRNASGQLTHAPSGLCLAVQGGTNANATPIVLATCDAAQAAQQWLPQNDTRHIYGPDGSSLLTIQGKQATLNLGEAQVTVQPGGVLVRTERTYSAPGGAVLRYANGSAGESLTALAMDHQGSIYAEVALSAGQPVRVRKQDPFGNQRGTDTAGQNVQSHKGFLGKDRDDTSGFQPLGARLYDPLVGRFLSADPILDLNDPLQSNGYAYAHNNPMTFSDPTGLSISLTASERAAALAGAGLSAAQVSQAEAMQGKSLTSVILAVAWDTLKDFIGINDAMGCFGGDMWSCGSLIIGAIPWTKLGKIPSVIKAVNRTINAIQAFKAAKKAAEMVLKAAKAAEAAALQAKKAAIEKAKKEAAQRAKKKAAEAAKRTADAAAAAKKKTGNAVQKKAQVKAAPKASSQSGGKGGGSKAGAAKPGGSSGGSARSKGGSSGSGGSGKTEGGSGGSCSTAGNSFVPGTKVLMADGSAKAIEKVKTGDKILATDPKTGETRVETVSAEIKGKGLKHLVKITIDVDGTSGSKTAEVTATDGHPFWVPELREWIDATDLEPGQWLQTGAGTRVQVTAAEPWTAAAATVHNLTVSNLHTYYVVAEATPVLVHNCGSGGGDDDLVTVYRGTDQGLENMIAEESGHLMSDAARSTYAGTGSMDEAMRASQQAHGDALAAWGSLDDYVQAHGSFGTEMAQIGPRSMMSFTTDINVARGFGGTIYAARIPRSQMILQTLPGAGEAEVLVPHMIAVTRL